MQGFFDFRQVRGSGGVGDLKLILAAQRVRVPGSQFHQQGRVTQGDFQTVQGRWLVVPGQFHFLFIRVTGEHEHFAVFTVAAEHRHVVFFVVARGSHEGVGFQLQHGAILSGVGRNTVDCAIAANFVLVLLFGLKDF